MSLPALLVRAREQNEALATRLEAAGLDVLVVPMLEIAPLAPPPAGKRRAMDLDRYDHLVFVSQNAVQHGVPYLQQFWPQWPLEPRWYAVGRASARALSDYDIDAATPGEQSSEGLLALPTLRDVAEHKVLIVRGRGGREVLKSELEDRGAIVDYLEVYERRSVEIGESERDTIISALPLVAAVYSAETATALAGNVGQYATDISVVVPSARVRSAAIELGFRHVQVATSPEEADMAQAIVECAFVDNRS